MKKSPGCRGRLSAEPAIVQVIQHLAMPLNKMTISRFTVAKGEIEF